MFRHATERKTCSGWGHRGSAGRLDLTVRDGRGPEGKWGLAHASACLKALEASQGQLGPVAGTSPAHQGSIYRSGVHEL